MSHIFQKLAKNNKPSESTSNNARRRLGDRLLHLSSITNVVAGTFSGFILLGLACVCNESDASATSSTLTVSVGSATGAYVNIPPTSEGKFGSTGTVTFSVLTTHGAGYTLTAGATALSYTDTDTDTTYTIDNLPANTAIDASTFESDSAYKNKWGYLPDKYYNSDVGVTVTDNTNYLPAPISAVQTLDITDEANPSTTNDYDITVGTKLDHTVQMGSYATAIKLAAVVNPTPYTVTYVANDGADGANTTNMPDNVDTTTESETITLSTDIPMRDGYAFKGWCTAAVSVDGTCSDTAYMGGETYALGFTAASNILTLYAVWGNCSNTKNLYNLVACQAKTYGWGVQTQTIADMRLVIETPTSGNPNTDISNSGVFFYRPSVHGVTSDAANNHEIYYFRGVLDSDLDGTTATYGSNGDGEYYHNYVKLNNDTCWRIVRTTGSGGIKMAYNGLYSGGTAANSCANATTDAQITSTYFNRATPSDPTDYYGTKGFMVYAGYNYNSDYGYGHSDLTSAVSNSLLFTNNDNSNAKTVIENWYAGNMTGYTSKLETSAGWCDDRATGSVNVDTTSSIPYALREDHFGAWIRMDSGKTSLGCTNTTGYDLLTTSVGLSYPIALLTLDEAELAGNGYYTTNPSVDTNYPSNWAYNSYLRSGSNFWLLSPALRYSYGGVGVARIRPEGSSNSDNVNQSHGLRPAISFIPGTMVMSGSGTASDPWVIVP